MEIIFKIVITKCMEIRMMHLERRISLEEVIMGFMVIIMLLMEIRM